MGRPRRMVVAWSSLLRTADEEALLSDGRFPDDVIGLAVEALHEDRVDVVTEVLERFDESGGDVFVQLDPYATSGTGSSGRSSPADTAANAMTARTSSSVSDG